LPVPIWLHIATGSSMPLYLQIFRQLNIAIAKSDLYVGEQLPSIRSFAKYLVVNPGTVARAYKMLEEYGLIQTKHGIGLFVSMPGRRNLSKNAVEALEEQVNSFILMAMNLGMSMAEIVKIFGVQMDKYSDDGRTGQSI